MRKRLLCLALMLSFCVVAASGCAAEENGAARLVCLNIGKADCMLLLWQDQAYLIDAGLAQTYPALEIALSQFGVDHLDGVFLTHIHKDHAGGLLPLSTSGIQVDQWYAASIYGDTGNSLHPAVQAAATAGQEVQWLNRNDVIPCEGGASFTVLGPVRLNTENENNNSLVLRFSCSAGSVLFAGDMKTEEEEDLLSLGALTPCTVLKAGHHGDNKATGKELLNAVQPKAALILTNSEEEADTPAKSTLKRLKEAGCDVYISQDYSDAMLLTLDRDGFRVEDVKWTGIPEAIQGLHMTIDPEYDTVTIWNDSSSSVSLNGCQLYSTKGDECFLFPNVSVPAGGSFVIGSRSTAIAVDSIWDEKTVWHKSKRDVAILYDAYGRALTRTDNGLEE